MQAIVSAVGMRHLLKIVHFQVLEKIHRDWHFGRYRRLDSIGMSHKTKKYNASKFQKIGETRTDRHKSELKSVNLQQQ